MKIKDILLNPVRGIVGTKRLFKGVKYLKDEHLFHHYETRRYQLIEHILHDKESGVTSERYVDHDIIVSLTSYGKRIHDVAFAIESIMQQSMKANRIILWLDNSFENQRLPQALLNQQKRGLEIAYCKDLRSYKKLIPALRTYPNDAIITVDDDLLYDYDILEHLMVPYLEHPEYIHSCRGHQMLFDQDHQLHPYLKWRQNVSELGVVEHYFLTSGGGTLFPPDSLDYEVFNEDVFMDICPFADDIWINAMAIMKGTIINKVYTRNKNGEDYILNWESQDTGLYKANVLQNKNDKQIEAVFSRYSLYDKLR
ncbi:MAG: hypothetical protein J6T00_00950 [Bacteroidaceae bacterium]|nr:hypothetical protein [Bacteroidaceae bacterium]